MFNYLSVGINRLENYVSCSSYLIAAAAAAAAAAAKSLQSCLTLCDPIDGSPLGSPVPGILQARVLEWVAIAFSAYLIEPTLNISRNKNCHYWWYNSFVLEALPLSCALV